MDLVTLSANFWTETVFSLILAGLGLLYRSMHKKIKHTQNEQIASKHGIQAILRDRIIQMYNFCHDKGYCSIYALENALSMYQAYKALGGNGTIDGLIQEMKDMPRRPSLE